MSYKSDFNKAYSKLNKINTNLKKDEENEVLFINTLLPIMLNTIKKCKTKKTNKYSFSFSYKLPAILLIIFLLFFFSFYYIQLIILLFVALFVYRIFF